ncbi:dynamin family protein, partial [Nocardia stercoris]|uniref:dynamin family protein n=1 Tax=Nocardia stercoris TaxID=2483361 RepID=UPI001F40F191
PAVVVTHPPWSRGVPHGNPWRTSPIFLSAHVFRGVPVSAPSIVQPRTASAATEPLVAVLDDLRAVADTVGRPDLAHRLRQARQRFGDDRIRVLVAGVSRKGVSSVVNALVAADACPTALPGRVPSAPVEVRYGERFERRPGGPDRHAEVRVTAPLLAEGMTLIDAPGVTITDPRRTATLTELLPTADAVLFVTDAGQAYTPPDIRLLQRIRQVCPLTVCVLNKIDSYPEWATVQQEDRRLLTAADLDLPILPVSAARHALAHRRGDTDLEVASGLPQLTDFLRTTVTERARAAAREAFAHEVRVVSDHLALAITTEVGALQDPARGAELVARIQHHRAAAEALRARIANWQYVLGDGITELTVAVDHDQRNRLRAVVRDAETEIAGTDPAKHWTAFGERLQERIATEVHENFVLQERLSAELAHTVAKKFDTADLQPVPKLPDADEPAADWGPPAEPETRAGVLQRAIGGVRGSYGGVLMVGMATSLIGLTLVNPWSIGAGVLLGVNTFREEHKAAKARRQSEAKVAVAKLMDEVVFQVSNESRARVREVQRALRDHFTLLAEQQTAAAAQDVQAAQDAAALHDSRRATRIHELEALSHRLRELRVRAGTIAAGGALPAQAGG